MRPTRCGASWGIPGASARQDPWPGALLLLVGKGALREFELVSETERIDLVRTCPELVVYVDWEESARDDLGGVATDVRGAYNKSSLKPGSQPRVPTHTVGWIGYASASTTADSTRRSRVRSCSTHPPHSALVPKRTKRRAEPPCFALSESYPRPQRKQRRGGPR